MARQISIDPVTRIEGHAKITLQLDEAGEVQDAQFHVTQFRGFEKLCEGRPFTELPSIMARICGICPVSHLVASAKACDALMAVRIPETAVKLRRLLNLAQVAQSHALSFFYLSAPDLLLGLDSNPEDRNLFGVLRVNPELARDGVRMRQWGQQIIERLGGKRIHPGWVVAGGVREPLRAEDRDAILATIPEAQATILRTLDWYKATFARFAEEIEHFANFPSLFMALVGPDGELEYYDGALRVIDADGRQVAHVEAERYSEYLGEAVEPWTYLKSPFWKALGYPAGILRVGPLARLNAVERCGTPLADGEWTSYRALAEGPLLSSFHYHYARLVEILYAVERVEALLQAPDILDEHVRARAEANCHVGIGVAEAPRGTLMHRYEIDDDGLVRDVNLMIATGHNNLAMNRGVLQAARQFVNGEQITDGMLNRVEAVIRCFDPCLSCSTHALGQMPLHVQLLGANGALLDQRYR